MAKKTTSKTRTPAKRRARKSAPEAPSSRPHICFERIIPDDQDPERHVRRALRAEMFARSGRELNAEEVNYFSRMAVVASKRWPPGHVLRCRFLDGSAKMQNKVRTLCREWEQHANVKIAFVANGQADVRISFYADEGSWSAVGRDALNTSYFPVHQPTMNFGWVRDDSSETEDRAVVLHEFGHALGCIHEHQQPKFDRTWNKAAVMRYFQGAPNYWSKDEIEFNVLKKYSRLGVRATRFDPGSIMLYYFAAELFSDNKGQTNRNTRLSALDKAMIGKMYP